MTYRQLLGVTPKHPRDALACEARGGLQFQQRHLWRPSTTGPNTRLALEIARHYVEADQMSRHKAPAPMQDWANQAAGEAAGMVIALKEKAA